MCKPVRRRYAHSGPFIKTNHKFGDDLAWGHSSYQVDYSSRYASQPPCRQGSPEHMRMRSFTADTWLNDTTPRLPAVDQDKVNLQVDRKKVLQRTNFRFGNDPPERLTAYADFAHVHDVARTRRRPCSPPVLAKLLPDAEQLGQDAVESNMRRDFTYFGPEVADQVHNERIDDLDIIKSTHDSDSVACTLRQKPPSRLLSRSMVDYRHPLHNVRCSTTAPLQIRREIAPQLKVDSIWNCMSSRNTPSVYTEARQNYSWPLCEQPTKRFKRGFMNKVR